MQIQIYKYDKWGLLNQSKYFGFNLKEGFDFGVAIVNDRQIPCVIVAHNYCSHGTDTIIYLLMNGKWRKFRADYGKVSYNNKYDKYLNECHSEFRFMWEDNYA